MSAHQAANAPLQPAQLRLRSGTRPVAPAPLAPLAVAALHQVVSVVPRAVARQPGLRQVVARQGDWHQVVARQAVAPPAGLRRAAAEAATRLPRLLASSAPLCAAAARTRTFGNNASI